MPTFVVHGVHMMCVIPGLNAALVETHSIVLVNWNGFPSIFQKVQYFHSRH